MIEKSDNITNLAAALLKAQKEIGMALKNAENPYYKSMYANMKAVINAVKEPLNNNGLSFLQAVNSDSNGKPMVETMLLHESGQYLCSKAPVYCIKADDPQAFGKGITYTKRYVLQAFLGLPTEDDDGEAAMDRNGNGTPPKATPKTKQNEIVEMAFLAFEAKHQAILKEESFLCFEFNREAFLKAIIKHFKALPTRKDSVKKIIETVKPEEVLTEIPQEAA